MKKLTLLTLLSILSLCSDAKDLSISGTHPSYNLYEGFSFVLGYDQYSESQPSSNYYTHSSVMYLVLNTEQYFTGEAFTYNASLKLDIELTNIDGSVYTVEKTLDVSFDNSQEVNVDNRHLVSFDNALNMEVTITEVEITDGEGNSLSEIPASLGLQSTQELERYYSTISPIQQPLNINNGFVYNNNLQIYWSSTNTADFYEFEWGWISDDDGNGGNIPLDELSFNFKNNSTRIRKKFPNYSIPLIYEKGYLFYRVRMVETNGPDAEATYFPWTKNFTYQSTINGLSQIVPDNFHYIEEGYENSLNWQHSVGYSEQGKRKDIIAYSDGTLRNRQRVTKLGSNSNHVIVDETIYDFNGRPAVSTLPTPISSGFGFSYQHNLNRNLEGTSFSWQDFDKDIDEDPCAIPLAPKMSTASGASQYYSAINSQFFIPDAEELPYTQIEYTADNTGRKRRESAPGNTFRLGGGHETSYLYGVPESIELDRLFGTDVGFSKYYTKEVVIDPNGQVSISFLDAKGNVIASALAGDSPPMLDPLPENGGELLKSDLVNNYNYVYPSQSDLPTNNELDYGLGTIHLNKTFLVEKEAEQQFDYKIKTNDFSDNCLPEDVCFECMFDLEISLKNECSEELIYSYDNNDQIIHKISRSIGNLDTLCSNDTEDFELSHTTDILPIGSYNLSKKLTLNQSSLDYYVEKYLELNNCHSTLEDFINEALSQIDYSQCDPPLGCQSSCETSILEADYNSTQEYENALAECIDQCLYSPCEDYKDDMLLDLYPGFQYGAISATIEDESSNVVNNTDWVLSVFNLSNVLGDNYNWRNPATPYLNQDGTPFKITLELDSFGDYIPEVVNGATFTYLDMTPQVAPQYLANLSDFLDYYEEGWSKSLLPYHPEYCYLDYCYANQDVLSYEERLNDANDFQTANDLGFMDNPASLSQDGLVLFDPLFSSYSTAIEEDLNTFPLTENTSLSLLEYSLAQAYCPELLQNSNVSAVINFITPYISTYQDDECYRDRVWVNIRNNYLQIRLQYVQSIKQDFESQNNCSNAHIGLQSPYQNSNKVFENQSADALLQEFNDLGILPEDALTNPNAYDESQSQELDALCLSTCEGMADQWMMALAGCETVANSSNWENDSIKIRDVLIAICANGCGVSNPFGSQSVNPDNGPIYSLDGTAYYNFEDVILDVIYDGVGPIDVLCTPDLISNPPYYGVSFTANNLSPLDECGCNELLSVKQDYEQDLANNNLASNITSLKLYASQIFGGEFYNMSEAFCACDESFGISGQEWSEGANWSLASLTDLENSNLSISSGLSCEGIEESCINCEDLFSALSDMNQSYGFTPSFEEHSDIIRNHMNTKFGFQLGELDYLDFYNDCQAYGNDQGIDWGVVVAETDSLDGEDQIGIGLPVSLGGNGILTADVGIDDLGGGNNQWPIGIDQWPVDFTGIENGNNDNTHPFNIFLTQLINLGSGVYDSSYFLQNIFINDFIGSSDVTIRVTNTFIGIFIEGCEMIIPLPENFSLDEYTVVNATITEVFSVNPFTSNLILEYINNQTNAVQTLTLYINSNCDLSDYFDLSESVNTLLQSVELQPTYLFGVDNGVTLDVGGEIITNDFVFISTVGEIAYTSVSDGFNGITISATNNGIAYLISENHLIPVGDGITVTFSPLPAELGSIPIYSLDDILGVDLTYNGNLPWPDLSWLNLYGTNDGSAYPGQPVLCNTSISDGLELIDPCVDNLENQAIFDATSAYQEYIEGVISEFKQNYIEQCMNNYSNEEFSRVFNSNQYQFTLYYYDQANNLVKTVPPQGVNPLSSEQDLSQVTLERLSGNYQSFVVPDHTLETEYRYNTINQLVWQKTPDGGETYFYYNALGQLIVSQNDKQAADTPQRYSYTRYDDLGRIVESGELSSTTSFTDVDLQGESILVSQPVFGLVGQNNVTYFHLDPLDTWYYESTLLDRTNTYYDYYPEMYAEMEGFSPKNLRGRVSCVARFTTPRNSAISYNYSSNPFFNPVPGFNVPNIKSDNATFYSYDIAGNIDVLLQQNSSLENAAEQNKRIDYSYDLVSGNVNEVAYQKGHPDQFFHRYAYDSDNRIIQTASSKEGLIWDRDAQYDYFNHGPLRRTKLGEHQVQGIDYAYTLQGWLKTVNSNGLDSSKDMGHDGGFSTFGFYNNNAKDVFAYELGYFSGDYIGTNDHSQDLSELEPNYLGLYNGNIKYMTTALSNTDQEAMALHVNVYNYDQLNRITGSRLRSGSDFLSSSYTDSYQTNYSYDRNGNILSLERNGVQPLSMDNLSYNYIEGTNQLSYVTDFVDSDNYQVDVDSQNPSNYEYDQIGNLVRDDAEEIGQIVWTASGKVEAIIRQESSTKPDLEFSYDGLGNRIEKVVKPKDENGQLLNQIDWEYTYYVVDASGNHMASYQRNFELVADGLSQENIKLQDHPIYGSSRLGVIKDDRLLSNIEFTFNGFSDDGLFTGISNIDHLPLPEDDFGILPRGNKRYELTNHLGNVLQTISDRKLVIPNSVTIYGELRNTYTADVLSTSDYYPFGMQMPERNFSSSEYRYGFPRT